MTLICAAVSKPIAVCVGRWNSIGISGPPPATKMCAFSIKTTPRRCTAMPAAARAAGHGKSAPRSAIVCHEEPCRFRRDADQSHTVVHGHEDSEHICSMVAVKAGEHGGRCNVRANEIFMVETPSCSQYRTPGCAVLYTAWHLPCVNGIDTERRRQDLLGTAAFRIGA